MKEDYGDNADGKKKKNEGNLLPTCDTFWLSELDQPSFYDERFLHEDRDKNIESCYYSLQFEKKKKTRNQVKTNKAQEPTTKQREE